MDIKEILKLCDHTELSPVAVWDDIKVLCDDGIKYQTASVCIPPSFVKRAKEYVGDRLKICTVIGFPNGYSASSIKAAEAEEAVLSGADEIDMVINIGDLKERNHEKIFDEINLIKSACDGRLLKVIIETCLLSDEEKIKMCEIVSQSQADFIKTSTGFSSGGATKEDIELFRTHIRNGKKIKAAGGIKSIADAETMINCGAHRLGTSRIVKIVKEKNYDTNSSY